jgi:hypothetical protein
MKCPKCGFQQEEGSECLRCGLIFTRYHAAASLPRHQSEPSPSSAQPKIGLLRRSYRIFRWLSLAVLVAIIFLVLHSSPPPEIVVTPESEQEAEAKIQDFQSSIRHGTPQRLELDESELNGWLGENLALKKPHSSTQTAPPQTVDSLISLAKTATGSHPVDEASLEQVQSSVRDVKIELLEDSLRLYATFDFHGMDLSLELDGKLLVQDGYIRLEPTSGKLGSFPLMAGTLRTVASRLFDSPDNKEQFRLPPQIRDMRIENGQMIIISR